MLTTRSFEVTWVLWLVTYTGFVWVAPADEPGNGRAADRTQRVAAPASEEEVEIKVERPTGPVATCVTADCHPQIVAGRFLHAPTAQEDCRACHVDADVTKHTYGLTVAESELCSLCHTQTERTTVHKPVSDKECLKCHDPHGSDRPMQLLADPAGALCLPCHKRQGHGRPMHGGDAIAMAGACNVCHEYHSSWLPKLLPSSAQELCLSCHQEMWQNVELLGKAHAPVLEATCLECHDAHTTQYPRQLRTEVAKLCYSCHDHEEFKKRVENSPVVHGALTTEASCNVCHVGHASAHPSLLSGSEKDLCLSCHDVPVSTEDGRTLSDLASWLKENPRHHGPIREGECRPCHDSHASAYPNLLTEAYPQDFYASFDLQSYALCFECHIEGVVLDEKGFGVTEFRDGERNLHFVHVNKERRGRTCLTCHEVHASAQPFHMRDTVKFGPRDWEIEIDYARLPNGGYCGPGCHDGMFYDRGEFDVPATPRAGLKPERLEVEDRRSKVEG